MKHADHVIDVGVFDAVRSQSGKTFQGRCVFTTLEGPSPPQKDFPVTGHRSQMHFHFPRTSEKDASIRDSNVQEDRTSLAARREQPMKARLIRRRYSDRAMRALAFRAAGESA
jgi:hypothetical protein